MNTYDRVGGKAKRERLGVNPFSRTQGEVNFLCNQARASVPRHLQMASVLRGTSNLACHLQAFAVYA